MSISGNLEKILNDIPEHVKMVAVSKTKSPEAIMQAYNAGQRIFGENRVQELAEKYQKDDRRIIEGGVPEKLDEKYAQRIIYSEHPVRQCSGYTRWFVQEAHGRFANQGLNITIRCLLREAKA